MIQTVKDFVFAPKTPAQTQTIGLSVNQTIIQMQNQLTDLKTQVLKLKNTEDQKPYWQPGDGHEKLLKESIKKKISELEFFLKNFRVMIFYLGPISSGKSTFINSMLAQQVMPSRNQQCTQGLILIEHDNNLALDKAQVYKKNRRTGLKEEIYELQDSVDKVYKFLEGYFNCDNDQNDSDNTLYIRINSHFHSQLPTDLQDRVIFVDTPGLNLNMVNQDQVMKHIQRVDSLIEEQSQTYHIVPISVWLTNYQTVDYDQNAQFQILNQMKNYPNSNMLKESLNSSDGQNKEDKFLDASILLGDTSCAYDSDDDKDEFKSVLQHLSIQDQSKQQTSFPLDQLIILLNKIDERKESQDIPLLQLISKLQNTFKGLDINKNLFKTSGLLALNSNIMKHGIKSAKDRYIQQFFTDNCRKFRLENLKQANLHCQKWQIDQDYDKFQDELLIKIKNMVQQGFSQRDGLLHTLQAEIVSLQRFQAKQTQQLSMKQVDFCLNLQTNRKTNNKIQVNGILQHYKTQFQEGLVQCLTKTKQFTQVEQVQKHLLKFVQQCIIIFDQLDTKLTQKTDKMKQNFFLELQEMFPQQQEEDSSDFQVIQLDDPLLRFCKQIFNSITERQVLDAQRQSFKKFGLTLETQVGVQIQRPKQGSRILLSVLIATSYFGRQAIGCGSLGPIPMIIGTGIAIKDLSGFFERNNILNPQQLEEQILIWGDSFANQLDSLATEYINILDNSFEGVETFLKRIITECTIL